MSFITDIRNIFRATQPKAAETRSTNVYGLSFSAYMSGTAGITPGASLTVDTVFRAIDILSKAMASMPLHMQKVGTDGSRNRATHPASALVSLKPNHYQNRFIFWQTFFTHAYLYGDGVSLILRNAAGMPTGFRLAAPGTVYYGTTREDDQVYKFSLLRPDGQHTTESVTAFGGDVLHFRTMSVDGVTGLSLINLNAHIINSARFANRYAAVYYEKGANMAGVVKSIKTLSDATIGRLRASIQAFNAGSDKAGNIMVLEDGMDFQPLGSKLADTSVNDTKKMSVEQIARIFGVPMHMLAALERATFNNIEHLSQQFVNDTLRPIAEQMEAELAVKMLSLSEMNDGYEFAYDFSALLRGDTKTQLERTRQLVQAGVISVNEARIMQNLNPVAGKDIFYVPLNVNTGEDNTEEADDGENVNDDENQPAATGGKNVSATE